MSAKTTAKVTCVLSIVAAAFFHLRETAPWVEIPYSSGQCKISPAGLDILLDVEGCRLRPYKCSAGKTTVGVGSTFNVDPNQDITNEEAAARLNRDVGYFERCVNQRLPTATLAQGQCDAYILNAYNRGCAGWQKSTAASEAEKGHRVASCKALLAVRFITTPDKVKHDCSLPENKSLCGGIWARRQREAAHCMRDDIYVNGQNKTGLGGSYGLPPIGNGVLPRVAGGAG